MMSGQEQLYNYYYNLQSKEMRSEIKGFKKLSMKGVNIAIKVIFKNDWLRVYQKSDGTVEWY